LITDHGLLTLFVEWYEATRRCSVYVVCECTSLSLVSTVCMIHQKVKSTSNTMIQIGNEFCRLRGRRAFSRGAVDSLSHEIS
jgi:hypothetical protein